MHWGCAQAKTGDGVPAALAQLRQLVATGLIVPAALVMEAAAAAEAAGLVEAGQWTAYSAAWGDAWSAICQASTNTLLLPTENSWLQLPFSS